MNRLFISALLVATAALTSCNEKEGVEVSGKLENGEKQTISLQALSGRDFVPLDSVVIGSNGEYELHADIKEANFYFLKLSNNNYVPLILDSTDTKVTVNGDAMTFPQTYEVSGSEDSKKLMEVNKYLSKVSASLDSMNKLYGTQMQAGATEEMLTPLRNEMMKLIAEQSEHAKELALENKNSLVALAVIDRLSPPDQYISTLSEVANALNAKYPQSEHVQNLMAYVNNMARLAVGTEAPELYLKDTEGNDIKLSDLRGKIVLIDFWASWCGPCRLENPNVVKVYNKYKSKGFEIFGVSLDKSKEAWVEAIKKDGLTWKHGSELAFWNSSFVKTYDVQSIPATYLIDGDGKILAKKLRGASLEEKLEEIFGS